jgi:hypothetical protein
MECMSETFIYNPMSKGADEMAGRGSFRLRGHFLLQEAQKRGVDNLHQLHLRSGVSWQTTHKYVTNKEIASVDLTVLADLLTDGVGLTPEEIANLRLGDIFEFVPNREG